jgi:hypothetical protein
MEVYNELTSGSDELAKWIKKLKSPMFWQADANVQSALTPINNYVMSHYSPTQGAKFLSGADPWLIAHAKATSSTVVSWEALVANNSQKPKIPNVCAHFGIPCLTLYQLLRNEKVTFR